MKNSISKILIQHKGFELMICASKVVRTERMPLCKLRPNTNQVWPSLYETLTTELWWYTIQKKVNKQFNSIDIAILRRSVLQSLSLDVVKYLNCPTHNLLLIYYMYIGFWWCSWNPCSFNDRWTFFFPGRDLGF